MIHMRVALFTLALLVGQTTYAQTQVISPAYSTPDTTHDADPTTSQTELYPKRKISSEHELCQGCLQPQIIPPLPSSSSQEEDAPEKQKMR